MQGGGKRGCGIGLQGAGRSMEELGEPRASVVAVRGRGGARGRLRERQGRVGGWGGAAATSERFLGCAGARDRERGRGLHSATGEAIDGGSRPRGCVLPGGVGSRGSAGLSRSVPSTRRTPALAVLACPGPEDLRGGQRPRGVLHGSAHPEGSGAGAGANGGVWELRGCGSGSVGTSPYCGSERPWPCGVVLSLWGWDGLRCPWVIWAKIQPGPVAVSYDPVMPKDEMPPYEDGLRKLGLFSLEKGRLRGQPREAFSI